MLESIPMTSPPMLFQEKAQFLKMWVKSRKQGGKQVTVEEGRQFLEDLGMLDASTTPMDLTPIMSPGVPSPTEAVIGGGEAAPSPGMDSTTSSLESTIRPPLGWKPSQEIDDWMSALQEVLDHQSEIEVARSPEHHAGKEEMKAVYIGHSNVQKKSRAFGGSGEVAAAAVMAMEAEKEEGPVTVAPEEESPVDAEASEVAAVEVAPKTSQLEKEKESVGTASEGEAPMVPETAKPSQHAAVDEAPEASQSEAAVVEESVGVEEVKAVEEVKTEQVPMEETPVAEVEGAKAENVEEEEQPVKDQVPAEEPPSSEAVEAVEQVDAISTESDASPAEPLRSSESGEEVTTDIQPEEGKQQVTAEVPVEKQVEEQPALESQVNVEPPITVEDDAGQQAQEEEQPVVEAEAVPSAVSESGAGPMEEQVVEEEAVSASRSVPVAEESASSQGAEEDGRKIPGPEEVAILPVTDLSEPGDSSLEEKREESSEEEKKGGEAVIVPQQVISEVSTKGFWLSPALQMLFHHEEPKSGELPSEVVDEVNKKGYWIADEDDMGITVSQSRIVLAAGKRTV